MTAVHGRSSPHRTPWLRSLTAADTCADVRVFVGRRLLPAGPPAEERMGGGEGRERPGLPRIWVGTGPASRVAHAPCQCPDRPDKRGPDRVQIRTRLRAQIQITIAPAVVLAIELPRCRTVGSRTDGRSPVHTEAARPAETGRRPAARRVHHAARRLVRQHPPDRPTSAPAVHQRTVSTSGRTSDHAKSKRLGTVFPDAVCERLAIVGVAAADIADERMRMSELAFGRTRNRSLLGTLNDFAFMAQQGNANRAEPESPEELMQFLSQTPILPLDGASPIELTRAAFGRQSVP